MGTLDYQAPDSPEPTHWRRRYFRGVPIIAIIYAAPVMVYWKSWFAHFDQSVLGKVPFFPLPLVPDAWLDPVLNLLMALLPLAGAVAVFILANGFFWGFCIIGGWHIVSSLRRSRQGLYQN
jgi:hypothetical protein